MPKIYKKTTKQELDNRPIVQLSEQDKNKAQTIITNFVNYFKTKHLS